MLREVHGRTGRGFGEEGCREITDRVHLALFLSHADEAVDQRGHGARSLLGRRYLAVDEEAGSQVSENSVAMVRVASVHLQMFFGTVSHIKV